MDHKLQGTDNSNDADMLFEQAGNLIAQRDLTTAQECLKRALHIKQSPEIYHRLGAAYFMTQNMSEAVDAFQNAVRLDPTFHKSYASLAEILRLNNQIAESIACWGQAIKSDPKNVDYLNAFLFLADRITVNSFTPELKAIMLNCLNIPDARIIGLSEFWLSLLETDDSFGETYKLTKADNYEDFKEGLDEKKLLEPLFLLGLARITGKDIAFEGFLTNIRHAMLDGDIEDLNLIVTMSQYCFITEYIFEVSSEEKAKLEEILSQEKWFKDPMLVAIVSCYHRLYTLDKADDILQAHQLNPQLKNILKTQLSDCLERQEIQKDIEPIVEITDSVSKEVQEQYEEFPYPCWSTYERSYDAQPLVAPIKEKKDARLLIAGCGTGREAISVASAFPDAHMLAVDLSKASLSYGMQKSEEFDIDNISFRHGDILGLGTLDQKFDYIASSGVLHHMEDPKKGWEVITGLLKNDGVMRIALYSRTARRHIIEARNVIAKEGYGNDHAAMCKFRREADQYLSAEAIASLSSIGDYYRMSECRDLLFHVQEHQFDLLEIEGILEDLGLEFIKMDAEPHVFAAYRGTNPNDMEGKDIKLWHAFEGENPDAFLGMYQFWCRKKTSV